MTTVTSVTRMVSAAAHAHSPYRKRVVVSQCVDTAPLPLQIRGHAGNFCRRKDLQLTQCACCTASKLEFLTHMLANISCDPQRQSACLLSCLCSAFASDFYMHYTE